MLNSRYFFVLPLLLFLVAALGLIAGEESTKWLLLLGIYLPLFVVSLLSRRILRRDKVFGYAHYVICCISLLLLVFMSLMKPTDLPTFVPSNIIAWSFVFFLVLTFMSFLVAVPLVLIPSLKRPPVIVEGFTVSSLDPTALAGRIDSFKLNLQKALDAIATETAGIEEVTRDFQKVFKATDSQYRELQAQVSKKVSELEEIERVSRIPKKELDLLLTFLNKPKYKYVDYLVGFVLGIISSALVQWLPDILKVLSG